MRGEGEGAFAFASVRTAEGCLGREREALVRLRARPFGRGVQRKWERQREKGRERGEGVEWRKGSRRKGREWASVAKYGYSDARMQANVRDERVSWH